MVGGLLEPDSDGGDVDGAAVHELALVVPGGHRAVPAEPVDRAFDGVALLVDLLVERRGPATLGTAAFAPLDLVRRFRDRDSDTPAAQLVPDLLA